MTAGKGIDNPMFDHRTLRMIVGVFAFGLPWLVYFLAGGMTDSISAAYHELSTRDLFVGSLFAIGALLISYKGHPQGEPLEEGKGPGERVWSYIQSHQEDLISTIGGVAAVTAALFPTAHDPHNVDIIGYIHLTSAFLLFANVAYFSIVAFLRSVNRKLLKYDIFAENAEFMEKVGRIRTNKSRPGLNVLRRFWNFVTLEVEIFIVIASEKLQQYERSRTRLPFARLLHLYGKIFSRGFVYVIFGSLTVLVLLVSVILGLLVWLNLVSDTLLPPKTTFVIETVAMWFFGLTWITASQWQVGRLFEWLWERSLDDQPPMTQQPGTS